MSTDPQAQKAAEEKYPYDAEGAQQIFLEGVGWRELNPKLMPALSPGKCEEYLGQLLEVVDEFISKVDAGKIKSVKSYKKFYDLSKRIKGKQ